ncbi:MAG: hypothetical protein QOE45_2440 [Frankiaceae bacterium]|jgi:hypothetical protein|nr:hypothetical protein [Frankiaceae bacterium]
MTRKLTLRAERLTELTTAELGAVAGASGLPCQPTTIIVNPSDLIPTNRCTGYYPSLNAPCTTA